MEHTKVVFESLEPVGARSHVSRSRMLLPVTLGWYPRPIPGHTINKIAQLQCSFNEPSELP